MTSTWRIKRHGRVNVGDCEGPVLELELALVAGQHDIGGLVQEGSHPPIPAFRDAAGVVDLSRLMAPWNQTQIGANISGSADARRIVDRSHKGERCQLSDAWDGHEPAAGRRGSCHTSHVGVDRGARRHHCGSCRNQSPHGGRKTGDPLACFKSLVDEGDGKRAGQSDPNTTAKPRICFSRVTRWPTSFLRAPISERTAWADKDFTCTGLKKPVRAKCARPRASLRSVLWVASDLSAWYRPAGRNLSGSEIPVWTECPSRTEGLSPRAGTRATAPWIPPGRVAHHTLSPARSICRGPQAPRWRSPSDLGVQCDPDRRSSPRHRRAALCE